MKAYKGFNLDWTCRGVQYRVGETVVHDGPVYVCDSGLHACRYPLEVFCYYQPAISVYAEVVLDGDMDLDRSFSTKVSAQKLTVVRELSLPELINEAKAEESSRGKTATTISKIEIAIDSSSAVSDRVYGLAVSSNPHSGVMTKELGCIAADTGSRSAAVTMKSHSIAATTGDSSAAVAVGNYSIAATTGYSSAAEVRGLCSIAAVILPYPGRSGSNARACGPQSAAVSTCSNHDVVEALVSTAVAVASRGTAKAVEGAAIMLVERDDDGAIKHVWAGIAGKDCKADTLYRLVDGKLEEV